MATATKAAQRAIKLAGQHYSNGNAESASRILGAQYRAAMVQRDRDALREAAVQLGVALFACEGM